MYILKRDFSIPTYWNKFKGWFLKECVVVLWAMFCLLCLIALFVKCKINLWIIIFSVAYVLGSYPVITSLEEAEKCVKNFLYTPEKILGKH